MQNIGLRSSGIRRKQNLGLKRDKAVKMPNFFFFFFFRFSYLMVMGIVLRKRCVVEQKNYDITSGRRDVDPHGWLRTAQGRMG